MTTTANQRPPRPDRRDIAIALLFAFAALALFLWRITDPAKLDFDETHYVPATRTLMSLAWLPNAEHPPLAKFLIGLGMTLFGDDPLGWRIMSAFAGTALVFAGVMAARWLLGTRSAAIMTGALLLFSQTLYIQARIAMLDIFMASFLMLAFWMFLGAAHGNFASRIRLALTGLFLGLAVACKWTAIPLVATANLAFLLLGWRALVPQPEKRRMLLAGFAWLGPFAVLVYLATFVPYMTLHDQPVSLGGIIPFQLEMLTLQSSPMASHPYQSRWWQWVLDQRPIWYFYEPVNGIQRGVLMIGNPAIMWGGLAALVAGVHAGVREGARILLVPVLLWAAALSFFVIIPKPVQFYYHYFVPSLLLCFASAGALDHYFWRQGNRLVPWLAIGFAGLLFVEFYPIISAAALSGPQAFNHWMWFDSWR